MHTGAKREEEGEEEKSRYVSRHAADTVRYLTVPPSLRKVHVPIGWSNEPKMAVDASSVHLRVRASHVDWERMTQGDNAPYVKMATIARIPRVENCD